MGDKTATTETPVQHLDVTKQQIINTTIKIVYEKTYNQ